MLVKTQKPALATPPFLQGLHQRAIDLAAWVKRTFTARRLLIGGGVTAALLVGSIAVSFFLPRTVNFSYAGGNCFTQPVVLPNLLSKKKSQSFAAEPVASFSIAGYPLFARTTCVTPTETPKEHAKETISFGMGVLSKNITVEAGAFPSLANHETLQKPVATRDPLVLKLNKADQVFEYRLVVNEAVLPCDKQHATVTCDVANLNLAQSASYNAKLEQMFKGKQAGETFAGTITTVQALQLVASSIAAGQTVHDVPTEMTLTLSREAVSMEGARLYLVNGPDRAELPATFTLKDKTITAKFDQPLARSASFLVEITDITAQDGGFLAPLTLGFTTSGGPKVLGVSIGSYKVSTGANVTITFDSAVSTTQNLGNFIQLEAGGSRVSASVSVSGNKVTIDPSAALPKCTALTVKVLDGLQNLYGIAGGSAWQYKSRTICQTVFSIGTSVQGRSITAYSFGSGPSKIIFVGGTHGDEKSSVYSLNSFVDYLESHYSSIPGNRTIIVIPNLNPDGYAASRRTNANNVDLNRNFPADDWKQGVIMPDKTYNANGGGSAPLSEPESAALAGYVLAQNPRLVLTYHAAAGVVMPNDSGDSVGLAQIYDQKSNLYYASNNQTGQIFQYDTTGSFETWLHDSPGIATLLIELWTKSSNEFSKNQNAMLHMVTLP